MKGGLSEEAGRTDHQRRPLEPAIRGDRAASEEGRNQACRTLPPPRYHRHTHLRRSYDPPSQLYWLYFLISGWQRWPERRRPDGGPDNRPSANHCLRPTPCICRPAVTCSDAAGESSPVHRHRPERPASGPPVKHRRASTKLNIVIYRTRERRRLISTSEWTGSDGDRPRYRPDGERK